MKVSDKVINAYKADGTIKYLNLTFPELGITIAPKDIYQQSQSWTEAIFNKDSIEFVGCISSKYGIKINGLKQDVKGKELIVDMYTDGTEDEPVRLFKGIVDSAERTGNRNVKDITAYDELYTKGSVDVAAWYKAHKFPDTIRGLRYSFFDFLGIEQVEVDLPNDDIVIERKYDPNTMQALMVAKSFCQINGAFGIMNRYGKFEYRIMGDIYDDGLYPGVDCYPGEDVFPGAGSANVAALAAEYGEDADIEEIPFSYYKNVKYEEFVVKPVDKVTIRQSEDDAGVTYGSGDNNYIIQGNMFTYGLSKDVLHTVAENIYNAVQGFSYYPYEAVNNGLPFVECGLNTVSYMMVDYDATYSEDNASGNVIYEEKQFPILSRTMTGIQALSDTYSAKGEEYQSEFVTDLQTQIDLIKRSDTSKEYVDQKFKEFEDSHYDSATIDQMLQNIKGLNVEQVIEVPPDYDNDTIYLIEGVVVVE